MTHAFDSDFINLFKMIKNLLKFYLPLKSRTQYLLVAECTTDDNKF